MEGGVGEGEGVGGFGGGREGGAEEEEQQEEGGDPHRGFFYRVSGNLGGKARDKRGAGECKVTQRAAEEARRATEKMGMNLGFLEPWRQEQGNKVEYLRRRRAPLLRF